MKKLLVLLAACLGMAGGAPAQALSTIPRELDSNLDGVVNLLQDLVLPASVPFFGFPFVITGTMEAEQFDRGGEGVAYHCEGGNTITNDYRASKFQIVTNTTDRGAGFIVDNLRSNEWLKYTLDVRVGQTYAVDARVAGIGTGGVFHVEFYTNNALAASTGPMTILNTNWHDLAFHRLYLPAGTNVMKVVMTNDSPSGAVCRLNYVSVYPSWVEGVPNIVTNITVTGMTNNDSSWAAATHNASRIRAALTDLPATNGGRIVIPEGLFYLAQDLVAETVGNGKNAAVRIHRSNTEIAGTNTMLVAHNRTVTIFHIGRSNDVNFTEAAVTNFTLSGLTLEGRPHVVAVDDGTGNHTNFWETGALNTDNKDLGNLVVFGGINHTSAGPSVNLLFTNCVFRNPTADGLWAQPAAIHGVAVRHCHFIFRDGTNGTYPQPRAITNPNIPTTLSNVAPNTGVGFFVRVSSYPAQNIVMQDCTFNGNPGMTAMNTNYVLDAGDGLFWGQQCGNTFISRCVISNYGLEGIQFNAGPAAATGNEYNTRVSVGATCALFAAPYWNTPTGSTNDQVFYLVGNSITGGRIGYNGAPTGPDNLDEHCTAHVSGNVMSLYPVFPLSLDAYDYPGQALVGANLYQAIVAGNQLTSGDRGIRWMNGCANAVVLKNDFSAAAFQGMTYTGTNGAAHRITILRNVIGQGTGHHLRQPPDDPGSFHFHENVFKHGALTVNPFFDPVATPVHLRH